MPWISLCFLLILCISTPLFRPVCCTPACVNNVCVWDLHKQPAMYEELVARGSTNQTTIRIHYAVSSDTRAVRMTAYEYQASALTMALEKLSFHQTPGSGFSYELIYMNDMCDPAVAISNFILMQELGVDAVFGIPCSTVTLHLGYLLSHYNVPLISYASNDDEISDKGTYNTVVRAGNGYKQIGRAFVEIFKAFNWETVSILARDIGLCQYGVDYIRSDFKANGLFVAEFNMIEQTVSDEELLRYLINFKNRARILIVCHSSSLNLRLLQLAKEQGMLTSEYAYFTFSLMPGEYTLEPWGSFTDMTEAEIQSTRELYSNMKIVTAADMMGEDKDAFMQEVSDRMAEHPWYVNTSKELGVTGSPYSLYLYDCMWLYLLIVNESLNEGLDPRNGTLIFEKSRNRIFQGVSGEVIMDDVADRIPNYWLWQIQPGDKQFSYFATLRMISEEGQRLNLNKQPYWGTADGQPPLNEPSCGYRHERCPPSTKGRDAALIGGFCGAAFFIIVGFTAFIFYRRKKFEEDLQKMTWKIPYEDMEFSTKKGLGSSVGMSLKSMASLKSDGAMSQAKSQSGISHEQIFTKVALYKGALCAVKTIHCVNTRLSRADLIELKVMKDMTHENLNVFMGASLQAQAVHILSSYCSKGSLQDILEHDEIKLDWMFKCSLINDLVNGMSYLHNSPLNSHGCLKSTNCLIDGRWVLKIANFGLKMFKSDLMQDIGEYEQYREDLWTAPEHLRVHKQLRSVRGSQKGDVYSFSIVLQEILFRAMPFFLEESSPKEVVEKVIQASEPPFRPSYSQLDADTDPMMANLMQECWAEDPGARPDFTTIRKKLMLVNKGRKINILDSMIAKLERYANNLEEIVEKRTEELVDEKKKTDMLLYRMLPSVVAEKLKHGQTVAAEIYQSVTIYFSDVVGFTSLSSESSPMQVVNLLNDLYTLFDDTIAKHDVYKVETIGDAYMCASGIPNRNGDRHVMEIANMSLELRHRVCSFQIRHLPGHALRIRIGLHSGSCAAGVVGLTMPRYCLFGDTVNVASRMESNGEAMKIHISNDTYEALKKIDGEYKLTLRGQVELKGKGLVTSYWLDEADDIHDFTNSHSA